MSNAADILAADTSVTSTFVEVGYSGTDFIVQTLRDLDSQTRSFVRQQQDAIKATHAKWNNCDSSPATKRDADHTTDSSSANSDARVDAKTGPARHPRQPHHTNKDVHPAKANSMPLSYPAQDQELIDGDEKEMGHVVETWTTIPGDIDLAKHLLKLYFSWEYPTFASLRKEYISSVSTQTWLLATTLPAVSNPFENSTANKAVLANKTWQLFRLSSARAEEGLHVHMQAVNDIFDRAEATLACVSYLSRCWISNYSSVSSNEVPVAQLDTARRLRVFPGLRLKSKRSDHDFTGNRMSYKN
ncbi:hypothetical protein PCL_12080 [Purpureocillium lilacinum]|uniref:Uncharacterized protein n=1 Tax=Purpureocillium lilacinum TaxID=33203 RepID=A0A2U3DPI2_PURLI|nr:hypothetical protein PCL_12080 [Purpureocillium lilacinum]